MPRRHAVEADEIARVFSPEEEYFVISYLKTNGTQPHDLAFYPGIGPQGDHSYFPLYTCLKIKEL